MSNTSFFIAPIHTWSLSEGLMLPYFSSAGLNNVSAFLGQENSKLYFFLQALMFFMSRLAVALLDWRPFSSSGGGGHLRWKVGYPPSQPVGSGFEPHWRLTTGSAALVWRIQPWNLHLHLV